MTKQAKFLIGLVIGAGVALAALTWYRNGTAPTPAGEEVLLRWQAKSFRDAVDELAQKGVVRDPVAFRLQAKIRNQEVAPTGGTYAFRPGMNSAEIAQALRTPLRQMVRIPEGWWISRVAARLEDKNVCSAQEYADLASQPELFAEAVSFTLPENSLEGFLFPDTYDLPPLVGAKAVITRQLQAFESKVIKPLGLQNEDPETIRRAVVVASMVELEAALDEERPKVAAVIENRIRRGMRLEIDATVLYAIGEWKVLGPGVVRTVQSPYNTYLNDGLPPGPIGSPSAKSIAAALRPDTHDYLFYVARPDRSHIFTRTYAEHRAAIRRARAETRAAQAQIQAQAQQENHTEDAP